MIVCCSDPRRKRLAWDPGIKIFAAMFFADCDQSAKSVELLDRVKISRYMVTREKDKTVGGTEGKRKERVYKMRMESIRTGA